MAGTGTILRIAGGTIMLAVIGIVTGVTVQVLEPMHANLDFSAANALGYPDATLVLQFVGLTLIGLSIVTVIWMIVAPIQEDVRQEQSGPF